MQQSPVISIGRTLFALAMLGFGAQYALYGHLSRALPPLPPGLPHGHWIAYGTAAFLLLFGVLLLLARWIFASSLLLGLFFVAASCAHLRYWHAVVTQDDARTGFLKALALGAAALVFAGLVNSSTGRALIPLGRVLFAFAMVIFGIQHFLYLHFVASLVPAWIPYHVYWTIFTGIALTAAGLALLTGIAGRAAGWGLFVLFLGWMVLLHAPRIYHALHNGAEWASGFVVLGLTGASLFFTTREANAAK